MDQEQAFYDKKTHAIVVLMDQACWWERMKPGGPTASRCVDTLRDGIGARTVRDCVLIQNALEQHGEKVRTDFEAGLLHQVQAEMWQDRIGRVWDATDEMICAGSMPWLVTAQA